MANFGENLRALRQTKKMTQQELSDSMGISKSAINMYERGDRQPNFEILELIADYFNVSIDFLLGKISHMQCPICYNTYNPLNSYETSEHNTFHKKFVEAENRYGKILTYGEATKKREDCIFKFRNPTFTLEEKMSAYEEFLKYEFMISLWNNNLDSNHDDFEVFCKKNIGLASTKQALEDIDPALYQALVDKYGILDDNEYHKVIQLTTKDNRDIKKDLDRIMEQLSNQEYGPAAYDGEDLSPEAAELFRDELEIALKRLKLINKEKYNPHKNDK